MIKKHFNLFIIAIAAAICFFMIACPNGENGGDPRPTGPEPMSAKTAMQYFIDEGITVGINLGNTLDAVNTSGSPIAVETEWGNPKINQALFNGYRDLGIKIIRIPVTYTGHIGPAPDYKVSEERLRRVAEVVNMAKAAELKVIINVHHDGNHSHGLGGWLNITQAQSDSSITARYEALWTQIAEYLKNYGDYLMFQGFNEIHDGNWGSGTLQEYNIINDWNQKFTNAVRGTGGNNATRYLLYYGYNTSYRIAGADYSLFKLPTDTAANRQIVGFHYYYPYDFSHDGKTHTWDTSANRNHLLNAFAAFKTNFTDKGIPVIIGENGPIRYRFNNANTATAQTNRLLFIDFLYGKARENGIVPFYWEVGGQPAYFTEDSDYGDFTLFNRTTGQPNSNESKTVIERMVSAVNNATPPTPPVIGEGTAAVFTSWTPIADTAGSTITHTTPSGRQRIQGTKTGAEGYANITATPDTDTLTLMRTMTSFSFMVTGDGKPYDVMIPTTESNVAYNHYRYTFTAPVAETRITVNVPANLTQGDWGGAGVVDFIQSNVESFQFQLSGTGTFDLTVWDIRLH